MHKYELDEDVYAQVNGGSWARAKLVEIDLEDYVRPFRVWFCDSATKYWVGPNDIKPIKLISTEKISGHGNCPVCGHRGTYGFSLFHCSNPTCQNYGR